MAGSLLLLLIGSMFAIFQQGSSAWRKTEATSDLGNELQKITVVLEREVERSCYTSLSLDPPGAATACSVLTPVNDQGQTVLSTTGYPVWQAYKVFYYDAPNKQVCLRTVPLAPASPEANSPEPIELYDAGGLQPLSTYRNGGRPLARFVEAFSFTPTQGMLVLTIQGQKKRYGRSVPEQLSWKITCTFRN